ncbi:MAG TPA: hypothetical protein VEH49_09525, partial [Methylomirabilota bacterium]|nr:hypothetical protein [Methylomirabilota bacterium]
MHAHRFAPIAVLLAALGATPAPPRAAAQQGDEVTVTITSNMVLDASGNARVQGTMSFNPPRGYDRVKRVYPNLYVLFRDVGPERSSAEINRSTLKITSDDGQRT